jgi:hypothetical protein
MYAKGPSSTPAGFIADPEKTVAPDEFTPVPPNARQKT